MNVKDVTYNAVGTVDMQIDHPTYGWIPFTASPDDTEQLGRDLYAEAIAGTLGTIAAYVAPPPSTTPNPTAFILACKAALGGPTGIRALPPDVQSAIQFTLFAISLGDWPDVQAYITPMQSALGTTYTAIKAAASQYNIPVVL